MNFFDRQEQAERRSRRLLLLFFMAICLVVLLVDGLVYLVTLGFRDESFWRWLQHDLGLLASGTTLLIILWGSSLRAWQLGTGEGLARLLGARPLQRASASDSERRLINIVEEISIASGTAMPNLYLLHNESGINAMVAGQNAQNCMLLVTKGALEQLSRDELQAVVGHEFSHIMRGDMQLNMRLLGWLAGIVALGETGAFLMRSGYADDGKGRTHPAIYLLGMGLYAIGAAGLISGRLIKAAVSRQREFLADASSVQFTRNPDAMAGALLRIQQLPEQSRLLSRHAEETSHMCFAVPVALASWFATHPPLEQRLAAIGTRHWARARARLRHSGTPQPASDRSGATIPATPDLPAIAFTPVALTTTQADSLAPAPEALIPAAGSIRNDHPLRCEPAVLLASVGEPSPDQLDYAHQLYQQIPQALLNLLAYPESARSVIYTLLLIENQSARDQAIQLLGQREPLLNAKTMLTLLPLLYNMGPLFRLPLVDLAMPALRTLKPEERTQFLDTTLQVCKLDKHISLFELALLTLLDKHLGTPPARRRPARSRGFADVQNELQLLLSAFAHQASAKEALNAGYFQTCAAGLLDAAHMTRLPAADITAASIRLSLLRLAQLSPLLRRGILLACLDMARIDGQYSVAELDALRLIAETLDCPIPPVALFLPLADS